MVVEAPDGGTPVGGLTQVMADDLTTPTARPDLTLAAGGRGGAAASRPRAATLRPRSIVAVKLRL